MDHFKFLKELKVGQKVLVGHAETSTTAKKVKGICATHIALDDGSLFCAKTGRQFGVGATSPIALHEFTKDHEKRIKKQAEWLEDNKRNKAERDDAVLELRHRLGITGMNYGFHKLGSAERIMKVVNFIDRLKPE